MVYFNCELRYKLDIKHYKTIRRTKANNCSKVLLCLEDAVIKVNIINHYLCNNEVLVVIGIIGILVSLKYSTTHIFM